MSINRIYRIQKEIKDLFKNPLEKDNIFIDIDDNDINIIKCLIIGTKDTPYYGGFFLFTLRFPESYPLSPPIVWFYTTKSKMRMNPNLYTNGKVCLSILNTWGNSSNWTPSMSVRSILISIQSMVLINNPIYNEPGFKFTTKQLDNYNNAVKYYVSTCGIRDILIGNLSRFLEKSKNIISFDCFSEIINNNFIKNIEEYIKMLKDNYNILGNNMIICPPPFERFCQHVNYKDITLTLINHYNKIHNVPLDDKYSDFGSIDLRNQLKSKLKLELLQYCRDNKIRGFSKLRKDGLIDLLVANNIKLE